MEEWENIFEEMDENGHLTEKQKRIIQAAIETFAEKGFSASSTNEIAKKAGVAEGTIFRHYKTKKDLLIAIVAPMMSRLIAPFVIKDLNKVLDQKYETFEDFLRAMVVNRKKFVEKNSVILKILIQEIPFHPELKTLFQRYVAHEPIQKVYNIILHFQNQGQIIKGPPATIMRLGASAAMGYVISRTLFTNELWDDDVEMEQTIQFILRGLSPENKD